jgi:hypothetical protein
MRIILLLLFSLPAFAQITPGNHQSCRNGASAGCTTSAISTTGASLLVAMTGRSAATGCTLSDSAGNAWTATKAMYNNSIGQAYYVLNPTTSGTHTFTVTPNGDTWCGLAVQAYTSTGILQALEQRSSNDGNFSAVLTSQQPGSITPNSTTELFVVGQYMEEPTTAVAVNSSFTIAETQVAPGGSFVGVSLAYRIPGAGTALNPTYSWSGNSRATSTMMVFAPVVSAPTISNLTAHASSSNGVVVEWDTTLPGDTQAKCGPAGGGPYTYVSPVLDPIGTGYSVTHHIAPVIGIPTNTTPSSIGCIALSATAGSATTTSSETTTATLAALSTASYRLIKHSAPTRYNDQFSGQNGVVSNSRATNSDTLWCTWAADGNEYCALNDGYGVFSGTTTLRNSTGYNTSIFKRISGTLGMSMTNIGALTVPNETGPSTTINYPTTYVADGGRPYIEGVISPGDRYGNVFFELVRYIGGWSFVDTTKLCITMHKSADYFETIVEAHNNNGPSALTKNFNASNAGLVDYPRVQADCWAKTFTNIWWLRLAKDYGGPWTGTGWTNTVTHAAGTDAWAYGISYASIDATNIKHVLVRYHRNLMAATRFSDLQAFTGTGYVAADYADDSKWAAATLTNGTAVRGDIGDKCQLHYIPSPVNRFWCVAWTYNNTADGDSGIGISIYDIGTSPTSFNLATFVGAIPIDKATYARFGPVFPELMLNTLTTRADGTISIRLSTTGNYKYFTTNATTNYYSAFYEDLTFGPVGQITQPITVGPGNKQYPSSGLKMLYTFDQRDTPNWSGGIPNMVGSGLYNITATPYTSTASWVSSDLGGEFGVYGANPYTFTEQLSTGYTTSDSDFTIAILYEHNTDLLATPTTGECAFRNTTGELSVCRSGTTANTWILTAKLGTISFTLPTDTGSNHLSLLIVRRIGSTASVYQYSGVASLPLTTLATGAAAGGGLAGGTLYLGSDSGGAKALAGTIGAFAYHNLALSDSEIVRAGNALLSLASARGAIVP